MGRNLSAFWPSTVESGPLGSSLIGVVEFSDLDGAFVEIIKQACIDTHLAKVLSKGLPVRAAAAGWAVVNADHLIAPDVGFRFA